MTTSRSISITALLAVLILTGCAARRINKPESWAAMSSEQRQKKLQGTPAWDPRILRYNNGQIEFVERRARHAPRAASAPERTVSQDTAVPATVQNTVPQTAAAGIAMDTSMIPLVYVHGLGGTMGDFAPLLLASDSDRTAIAVNLPGTGLSTNLRGEYTISAQAQALHELLIHRMAYNKVDLICHSLGGQVCIAFGLEHPANVSSLTLVDAAGSYDQGEFAERMAKQFGRVNLGSVSVANHPAITIFTGGDQAIVSRLVSDDPTVISALDSFNQNYKDHIRNLSMPVLLIWGENDPIFPIQSGFFLLNNIKNIRMKVVPRAGHVPQLTDPALVQGWIRDFHHSLIAAGE